MEYFFLLSRILFGGFFLWSGWSHFSKREMMAQYAASKGVPSPNVAVCGTGIFILLAGLGIITGIYVVWAVWGLVIFLTLVTVKMHAFWKIEDQNARMADMVNFSKNIALLGASLSYLFVPQPWMFSLYPFFFN